MGKPESHLHWSRGFIFPPHVTSIILERGILLYQELNKLSNAHLREIPAPHVWNKGGTPSEGNNSLLVLQRSELLHAPIRISRKATLPGLESLSLIRQVLEQLWHNHHSEKGCFYCMDEPPGATTRFLGYISCMACMSHLYWRTIMTIINIGMFLKSNWVVFPIFSIF